MSGPGENFGALRELQSLTKVSDAAVMWLAEHVESEQFAVGELLITQGDEGRECYFIVDGETEITRDGAVLGVSGRGEPEGELGLFLRTPRAASTTARTPVSTLVLRADHWDGLCDTQPDRAEEIRVAVCRHLAERFNLPSFAGVALEP